MLFKQLKYFTEVIKCGSFTEAAERCSISQSAISQQIRALEESLGVELIKRKNRKFSLTPAGDYFYRHGLVLLDEAERLKRETVRIGSHKEEHLKIGYLSCYGGMEFRQAAAAFSGKYPELTLEIATGSHEELYEMLRFDGADLILNDHRRTVSEDYESLGLVTSSCFIEISEKSALSALTYVTMEDLRKIPCILIASEGEQDREKEYYVNELGVSDNFLYADTLDEGRLLAAANKGFLPVEFTSVDSSQPEAPVCRIPVCRNGKQIKRKYCAYWKKERGGSYIEEFAEVLRQMFMKDRK
ncbi:LysR family transcriptional regulator [Anaerostipes sp.]|uniref:LysR family transcriptional regulator n=1 Tax=Anaerostipes sp. TaxID=1872530 RepID=UPI0025BFC4AF|nr:LysR family transcriptional regulator [Anaerostipes sp.]MBS7008239.1 LysR family transcriptional regulator [Anaerostipes sp.]